MEMWEKRCCGRWGWQTHEGIMPRRRRISLDLYLTVQHEID
jgi:hypothetical protein